MNSTGDSRPDFDEWLTRQFSLTLGPERGPRAHPADAAYAAASRTRAGRLPAARSGILAPFSAKAVVGAVAAALATGGAVAALATGSVQPATWGQHVVQTVRDCQAGRTAPGTSARGIGQCVSAVAGQHGGQQRARHTSASPTATPGSPSPLPGKRLGQTQNGPPASKGKKGNPPGHGQGSAPANAAGAAHGHGSQGQPTPVASP